MNIDILRKQYSDKSQWPTLLNSNASSLASYSYEINCKIHGDLSYFEGHFPNQPVLPGVAQVHWANDFAQNIFKIKEFRGVNSLKFNTMILPDTQLTLYLTFNPENLSVKFSYASKHTVFSTGILIFSSNC